MSKVKKGNKGSKNVKNNVIPFKSKKLEIIKNVTPMSKQEVETARVNDYAKEVCKNLDDFAGLTTDDLLGYQEDKNDKNSRVKGLLENFNISKDEGDQLIMEARKIWLD